MLCIRSLAGRWDSEGFVFRDGFGEGFSGEGEVNAEFFDDAGGGVAEEVVGGGDGEGVVGGGLCDFGGDVGGGAVGEVAVEGFLDDQLGCDGADDEGFVFLDGAGVGGAVEEVFDAEFFDDALGGVAEVVVGGGDGEGIVDDGGGDFDGDVGGGAIGQVAIECGFDDQMGAGGGGSWCGGGGWCGGRVGRHEEVAGGEGGGDEEEGEEGKGEEMMAWVFHGVLKRMQD